MDELLEEHLEDTGNGQFLADVQSCDETGGVAGLVWEIEASPYFAANYEGTGSVHVYTYDDDDPMMSKSDEPLGGRAIFLPDLRQGVVHLFSFGGPIAVLHEMAHLLSVGDEHGEAWRGRFIDLVRVRYGDEAASLMETEYTAEESESWRTNDGHRATNRQRRPPVHMAGGPTVST